MTQKEYNNGVRLWADDVYRFAVRCGGGEESKDAVQEALTRALTKRHLADPLNYGFQAVRHAAIDIMRYNQRYVPLDETVLAKECGEMFNDYKALLVERAMQIRDNLPVVQRKLVILHDEDGISYADISKMTGISQMTIRRQLKKAHATMRYEMKKRKENNI